MTEHVCKYEWDEDVDGIRFLYCHTGCTDTVFPDEIKTRVNATERLSALQARELIVFGLGSTRIAEPKHADALRDYADTLEEK